MKMLEKLKIKDNSYGTQVLIIVEQINYVDDRRHFLIVQES